MNRKDISNISLSRNESSNIQQFEHENFVAGFPPFLRGTNATMFVQKPWRIQENASLTDNKITIESYPSGKKNINTEEELAQTLLAGLNIVKEHVEKGHTIDSIATKLLFVWKSGTNHFIDIAKIRAARMLWTKLIMPFNPKNTISLALQASYKIESSYTEDAHFIDPVTKSTIEAISGVFGGANFLNYSYLDNIEVHTKGNKSKFSIKIDTFLQNEIQITKTVDPWGGSFYLENLTDEIATNTWNLIQETKNIKN